MKRLQILIIVFLILLSICAFASMQAKAQTNGAFVFNSISSPQTAGTPFTITITDEVGGVPNSGFTGIATLTVSTGTITPTNTAAFASGAWTGQVTVTGAGSSVSITANSGSSLTGTSNSFTVDTGAFAHFGLVVPSSVTAGSSFGGVVVTAYDNYGNVKTDYVGSVYFISSDSQATLPYSSSNKYTFVSGDKGANTFSGFTLTTAPSQTITVTDGSVSNQSTPITVNAAGLDHFVVGAPISAVAGSDFTLSVTAKDHYGNTITSYSSSVSLSASPGTLSLSSTGTSGWSSGVWSDNAVTLSIVGSITITATAGSATGTATLTVTAGAATQFVVSGFPNPITAGAAGSVTVTAKDEYGNTATGYAGTVMITSSDGQAVLPASSGLSSGTGSFSVTLETAGSQSITATDTVTSSITGSQTAITVNAAGAVSLVVSGFPNPAIAGAAGSVTVTAKDEYGNTATGYSGTVKITSSDGKAVLPANAKLTSGVGSFSVTLETAGSQSITATDTVTSSITGSQTAITVNAAGLDHFVFNNVDSQAAGSAFTITVTAQDAFNNTVTSYVGTPSLTYSAGSISPTTMSAFVGGVGSSSVTLAAAGSGATITAADGTHSGISNTFTVTSAPTPTPSSQPTATPISTGTSKPTATPTPKPGATPTPSATPSPTHSQSTVLATNGTGATVDLGISGNVTSSQISDAIISSYPPTSSTTVSFTLAVANGATASGKMTIPKTALYSGSSPVVYIDGLQASIQDYTQDANNFYVSFTASSGVHDVSIQFVVSSKSSGSFSAPVFVVGITVPEVTSVFTVIAVRRLRRKPDDA